MFLAPRKTNIDPFEMRLLHHRMASRTFVPPYARKVARTASSVVVAASQAACPGAGEAAIDEVREYQETLHRLREGSVGLCDGCGQRISRSGMMFKPLATLCLHCRKGVNAL